MKRASRIGLTVAGLLAWSGCNRNVTNEPDAPAASGIRGRLVDGSGKAVADAKVWVLRDAHVPVVAKSGAGESAARGTGTPAEAHVAYTDGRGRYAFPGLEAGEYGLQADYDSRLLTLFRPGLAIPGGSPGLDLGTDTLRVPGRIIGKVANWYEDRGGILCGIPGSGFLASSDSDGRFAITGVPAGVYALTYRSPGFLPGKSAEVVVVAGATVSVFPDTLVPEPETLPPPPWGLHADYDSAAGTVTLRWRSSRIPGFRGFRIAGGAYRGADRSRVYPRIGGVLSDTVFVDTLCRYVDQTIEPLQSEAWGGVTGTDPFSVLYTVSTLTSRFPENGGKKSILSVESDHRAWEPRRQMAIRALQDSAFLGDSLYLELTFTDAMAEASEVNWTLVWNGGSSGSQVTHHRESRDFKDTLAVLLDKLDFQSDSLQVRASVEAYYGSFEPNGNTIHDRTAGSRTLPVHILHHPGNP